MSGNNLSVRITADVVDLQTKFAVAKAEVAGLSSEMNKLGKASAAGVLDSAGQARLTQVASDFLHAKSAAAGLSGQLAGAAGSMGMFSHSLAAANEHSATGVRYIRELFDEISSGRTRYLPSTMAAFGQSVLHMNLAMLGAVGGAAALAGGLGYLAYRAIEAQHAFQGIKLGADFAGNLDLTTPAIQRFAEIMSSASNVSSKDAQKIAGVFARIPGMTQESFGAAARIIAQWAEESGQSADKAAGAFAKLLAPTMTAAAAARELAKTSNSVTQPEINAAEAADRTGNANTVMAAKLTLMNAVLKTGATDWESFGSRMFASLKNFVVYTGFLQSGIDYGTVQEKMLRQTTEEYNKQASAVRGLIAAQAAQAASPEQLLKTGVSVATKENPVALQVQGANAKIAQMNAALAVAKREGDQIDVATLNAGLAKARENLANLQFGPAVSKMREQMAELAASWDGTQTGLLEKQRQIAAQALASVSKDSKEYLSIQQQIAHLDVQIHKAAGDQVIADARTRISAINADESAGATQRLAQERAVWQQVLASDRLTAAQRLSAERAYNQASASLIRERASQALAIRREDANTDIAIERMKLEARKSSLAAEVAAGQISAQQRLAMLRGFTEEEYALNLKELQGELAAVAKQPVEYERVYNQIRKLKEKLVLDLAALDQKAAIDAARANRGQVSAWDQGVKQIEGFEGTFISNILSGRRSLGQSMIQIADQVITREIQNDLRAMTTKLLMAQTEANSKKALEQGGYLYHLLFENAKTAATAEGTAMRWMLTEAAEAKTLALKILTAGKTIAIDAAEAAAGAFKAIVGIPIVGPVLAAAAATAAFVEVKNLAHFDVGAWNIPHDMPAMVHAGEMILPPPQSSVLRDALGGGRSGAGSGDVHVHGPLVHAETNASPDQIVGAIQRAMRNFHPAVMAR